MEYSDDSTMFSVLPSVGVGALSAREAEGRSNISTGEKVYLTYPCVPLPSVVVVFLLVVLQSGIIKMRTTECYPIHEYLKGTA
jgi:hypothetical protein